ncbi:hypothetical protein RVR_2389 [Actinacidiphila reveromycinica]|uniref:Uncharacterized protein n=1 Tax=Actinacidiphila reveromycinica TaxID=659352 RepID=A0A7U3UQN3_9ACTN|nr:DUF6302 family protein [Streptomyces sp. SN-593]BBA96886.1 hypothetical protein RVR_2389 [Streptomyces sp. SN-593]
MNAAAGILPRLVPAYLAYDFEHFARLLADPELLRGAVGVRVHRAPLLAVPIGGTRLGGSMSIDLIVLAEKVHDLLLGLRGFPDLRVLPSPYRSGGQVVEWGARPPSSPHDDAARSRFYGYSEAAIERRAELAARRSSSTVPQRSPR